MSGPARHALRREEVELCCLDFGGAGAPALLLHGLAGHAGEWAETASWLADTRRVLALDLRGHGHSSSRPPDVSPEAHVADIALAIEQLAGEPVLLCGQSLGANLAFIAAAARPDLVAAVIVAEGHPGGDPDGAGPAAIERWFESWPRPFASHAEAVSFFGGGLRGEAWADGLEERDGALWPRFDPGVMVRTLREATVRDHWEEWERIECPALVVRAGRGYFEAPYMESVAARARHGLYAEVPDAGHDLHLEDPAGWRRAIEGSLSI